MSSFSRKGNRSFNKSKFNKNEKLTIDWVVSESRNGKPIITDTVLKTLGSNSLKKVVIELEKRKILTFTNYSDNMVVFVRENNNNPTISEDGDWRVGFIKNNENITFLPTTPKNI